MGAGDIPAAKQQQQHQHQLHHMLFFFFFPFLIESQHYSTSLSRFMTQLRQTFFFSFPQQTNITERAAVA